MYYGQVDVETWELQYTTNAHLDQASGMIVLMVRDTHQSKFDLDTWGKIDSSFSF